MCIRSSKRTKEGRHQAQTVWHQPVWKPVLTSCPPSSQRSSTDHWNCAKFPHALNAPPSSPIPKKKQKWLHTCGSNVWGHEIIWKSGFVLSEVLHWTLTGPLAVCLRGWCSQHRTALHPAAYWSSSGMCPLPTAVLLDTPITAHLKTPLSSSWSLQMTPHWSASSRTVTSLLTDRRLRSWLSGAVLTTRLKLWRWLWTSGETPCSPPTHHHGQHCDCSGVIQITGHHNFSGPEVGQ